MSHISNFIKITREAYKTSKKLSAKTGYSRLWLTRDIVSARYRHKAFLTDYVDGKFYRLTKLERKDYLTIGRQMPLYRKLNNAQYITYFKNKATFLKWFKDIVRREWMACGESSSDAIRQFVVKHRKVFAKPLKGSQGSGIFIVTPEKLSDENLSRLSQSDYVLEECVVQDERMNFGSKSVNTLRVYTLIDKGGQPKVIKALVRAGVGDAIVDNFHQGGVIYPLNIDTGKVEGPGCYSDFECNVLVHPGTDIFMPGFEVPHWQEVLQTVKKGALLRPEVRFVGWDVAITSDGVDVIEGNDLADMDLLHLLGQPFTYKDFLKEI